jgi:hypothetical protein
MLFPLVKVLAESLVPVLEPAGEFLLQLDLGFEPGVGAVAGGGLDLAGEAMGFLDPPCFLGIDLIAQFLELAIVALLETGQPDLEHVGIRRARQRAEIRLEPFQTAFDAVHLAADEDFADPFHLA